MPETTSKSSSNVNRRQFTRMSVAAAASAAIADSGEGAAAAAGSTVVDDFKRRDSFYHGHGWESLNPVYWKVDGNALRRRIRTRASR